MPTSQRGERVGRAVAGVLALVVACSSACSWTISQPVPPRWQPSEPPRCNDIYLGPAIDIASAGVFGLGSLTAFLIAAAENSVEDDGGDSGAAALVGVGLLVPTVVFLLSSRDGITETERCRAAMRAYRQQQLRSPANDGPPGTTR